MWQTARREAVSRRLWQRPKWISFRKVAQIMPVSQEGEPELTIYRALFLSDVPSARAAARPGFCSIS